MVLITGATDGLGLALARELVAAGEAVLLHGRDASRGERAVAETGAAGVYLADFASLDEVRALAAQLPPRRRAGQQRRHRHEPPRRRAAHGEP